MIRTRPHLSGLRQSPAERPKLHHAEAVILERNQQSRVGGSGSKAARSAGVGCGRMRVG